MGKRSNFDRIPRDFYPTPLEAVRPLVKHLPEDFAYDEPCAGAFDLCLHLDYLTDSNSVACQVSDIEPRDGGIDKLDAFEFKATGCADFIITNPPWDRKILHPMIEHFSAMRPTWLLFDSDWMHTKQSAPFMPWLRKVVSVGRVKWIPDSKHTGKDNCCWYLFDQHQGGPTVFAGRAA
ncbi:MAG: class I SAM-dependent methyltransferase [Pikeienuella sp.]